MKSSYGELLPQPLATKSEGRIGLVGAVNLQVIAIPPAVQALRPHQSAEASFRHPYEHHRRGIYRLAVHLCGHKAAATVTQEVLFPQWRSRLLFDETKRTLRAYLLK